jgi:transposase InsO family protein
VTAKYEFIDAEKAHYPIVKMCTWLRVSKSGFYEWRDRPISATARRREYLKAHIVQHFELSRQTYGYRRIHAALRRQGEQVSPELVRDLMRELDLRPCQPRPFRPTTTVADPAGAAAPDLVDRDFTAAAPGTKFVGDITYIPTGEGWL